MSDRSRCPGRVHQLRDPGWGKLKCKFLFLLMAGPMMAWGLPPQAAPQGKLGQTIAYNPASKAPATVPAAVNVRLAEGINGTSSPPPVRTSSSAESDGDEARKDLESCRIHEVRSLPGSHQFGSDFIEAMAVDPDPKARDRNVVWGLTADLSSNVPAQDRAMYILKSTNGGKTWTQVARVDSPYFDAGIGEGERNGLSVSPGGTDFVITTQRGAFQVFPQSSAPDAAVRPIRSIMGPRVPQPDPTVSIPKREGDPVTANVVKITADGKHMIVGYGYFDLHPQFFTYRKGRDGSWIQDGLLPHLPTQMDILSMQFGDPKTPGRSSLYVGTGDQAFQLKAHAMSWTRIDGVGADSAVQGISTVGGPHLAACWGVYNPLSADDVERVTHASFLLHRDEDEAGANIRAFSIEVDPSRPNREVVTSLTGVYTSKDRGEHWKRLNDLPDGEFRSAHFNSDDGTVIVSGIEGTFLANPFATRCTAHLRTRDR